jgi:hypothetical protein
MAGQDGEERVRAIGSESDRSNDAQQNQSVMRRHVKLVVAREERDQLGAQSMPFAVVRMRMMM